MIRISSNTLAARLTADLERLSTEQSRYTQQLANGKRLIDASDDVPATGRLMGYDSEKRQLQQYERNAQRGLTDIVVSMTTLDSLKGLASQAFNIGPAASTTGDPAQRAALATKLDGLIEQALSLANQQVNGKYLFGAQENTVAPFAATRNGSGQVTAVTYNGSAGSPPAMNVDEGSQVFATTDGTMNQQLATFITNAIALRDAITANDQAAMTTIQNAIGDDEDNMVNMVSQLSTSQFRIEVARTQNKTRFNQLANLANAETDADVAETIVKFQAAERSYQAALQAGSRILQQSLLDYI